MSPIHMFSNILITEDGITHFRTDCPLDHCIKLQNLCTKESSLLEYVGKHYPNMDIRSLEDEWRYGRGMILKRTGVTLNYSKLYWLQRKYSHCKQGLDMQRLRLHRAIQVHSNNALRLVQRKTLKMLSSTINWPCDHNNFICRQRK